MIRDLRLIHALLKHFQKWANCPKEVRISDNESVVSFGRAYIRQHVDLMRRTGLISRRWFGGYQLEWGGHDFLDNPQLPNSFEMLKRFTADCKRNLCIQTK